MPGTAFVTGAAQGVRERVQGRSVLGRHRAVVVSVVVVVLGVAVAHVVGDAHRRDQLQAATTSAYERARPGADRRRAEADATLRRVSAPAAFQAASVSCRLEEDDAGLVVQNWRQVCTIRTVDIYPTTSRPATVTAQLNAADGGLPDDLLGVPPVPVDESAHSGGCLPLRGFASSPGAIPELRITLTRLEAHEFSSGTSLGFPVCGVPPQTYDDVAGTSRTRVEKAFPPAALDLDRSWLVMERETVFVRQDLGCHGLVFCGSPLKHPVLP